jgi:hexosaminidase
MRFLQDMAVWLFMPRFVRFESSADGRRYGEIALIRNDIEDSRKGAVIRDFTADAGGIRARYIRIYARSIGRCPAWHRGAGGRAWLFTDECRVYGRSLREGE